MKKLIALLLALVLCLSLVACGESKKNQDEEDEEIEEEEEKEAEEEEEAEETEEAEEAEKPGKVTETVEAEDAVEPEEEAPNYAELLPVKLQGVWGDLGTEGILTVYAYKDNNVETYAVNFGEGAAKVLSGTYTIGDGQLDYDFGGYTGYSTFTYEDDVLTLINANGVEIERLGPDALMEYLVQEESCGNNNGTIVLADLIVNNYPESEESAAAQEKKAAAEAAIQAAGEAALQQLNTQYDKVQGLTWYQHKNEPQYVDICCYIYPYIGRMDDGTTWLRVAVNYTDAPTDAGWIFFDHIIFSVDGVNTTKTFAYNEIYRDNDTEVWETADFEPNATEIVLLREIANSTETIIRFEGDQYYVDHVVTDAEKTAILDVLAAYEYLTSLSE